MDIHTKINTLLGLVDDIERHTEALAKIGIDDKSRYSYLEEAYAEFDRVRNDLLQIQNDVGAILDINNRLRHALKDIQNEIDDFEE